MEEDSNDKPNFYQLLCVDSGATKEDIKKAYRKQALLFHPDKMKPHMKEEASQHFQLISEAYEVLSDDSKRALYDRYGYEGVKAGGNPNPEPEIFHPTFPGGHQGFPTGFNSPFFASFGVPADPFFNSFANHHAQHMRFNQQMDSMFNSHFGAFPSHEDDFFGGSSHFKPPSHRGYREARTPTLFETSPFAGGFPSMGGGFSSSTSSSSFGGGGGTRSSTRTTIVNGMRTTVTEVTDAQGVTTVTKELPDGTRQVFVDGVPASIEGVSSSTRNIEGNAQRPILVSDDDDSPRNNTKSTDHRRNRYPEPIVLDDDDDDDMYESISHRSYPRRNSNQSRYNDPNLYHPRMGQGQTLGGSNSRSRYRDS